MQTGLEILFILIIMVMVDPLLGYPRSPSRYGYGRTGSPFNKMMKLHLFQPPPEMFSISAPVVLSLERVPLFASGNIPLQYSLYHTKAFKTSVFPEISPKDNSKGSSFIHFVTTGNNNIHDKSILQSALHPQPSHPQPSQLHVQIHLVKGYFNNDQFAPVQGHEIRDINTGINGQQARVITHGIEDINMGTNGQNARVITRGIDDINMGTNGQNARVITHGIDDINMGTNGQNARVITHGIDDINTGTNGQNTRVITRGIDDINMGTNGQNARVITYGIDDINMGTNSQHVEIISHGVDVNRNVTTRQVGSSDFIAGVNNHTDDERAVKSITNQIEIPYSTSPGVSPVVLHDAAHGVHIKVDSHSHEDNSNSVEGSVGVPVNIENIPLVVNNVSLYLNQAGVGLAHGDISDHTNSHVSLTNSGNEVSGTAVKEYNPFSKLMDIQPFGPGPYYECRLPSRVVCNVRFGWNHVDGMQEWCKRNCVVFNYSRYCDDTRCGCICKYP